MAVARKVRRRRNNDPNDRIANERELGNYDFGQLEEAVKYECYQHHKHNGRSSHGIDKTPCDKHPFSVRKKKEAEELLQAGLSRRTVGHESQKHGNIRYPKHIWAVKDGIIYEANLNFHTGIYHGYGFDGSKWLEKKILKRWRERK